MTTSPASVWPLSTRTTPTASTSSTPRLGRAASAGSNAARIRPARMLTSRSSMDLAANRRVSSLSRPSVLTTMRAVERLVRDLADLGAQLLRAGHQRRGLALVEHVGGDHGREDEQPDQREHEVGEEHLHDGDHHHRDGADRHRQRRDRAPGGLDVGVGVGEQLAGRVALVPLHREAEVLAGDRAAVVRLHAVLHDAGAEPAGRRCRPPAGWPRRGTAPPRRAAARSRSRRRGTPGGPRGRWPSRAPRRRPR